MISLLAPKNALNISMIYESSSNSVISMNSLKCVFCISARCLLGFIISQCGITVDPLKVQAITKIPPPQNLHQLLSLQGKDNFLCRFFPDYTTQEHGFIHFLCHDIPFHWDEHAQNAFDDIKTTLSNTSLISPPDYNRDYILYISTSVV
jgi:hypothetical protein